MTNGIKSIYLSFGQSV